MRGLGSWAPAQPLARASYKSAAPQRAVAPRVFKMNAGRNFSELAFRSGSQPLKFFHPDDVGLEYYIGMYDFDMQLHINTLGFIFIFFSVFQQ